jgi:hypothetical protein
MTHYAPRTTHNEGSWRSHILREFTPKVARLTLVADPDGLLLEEGVLEGIRERGFELIPFEDPIAFRYAYESRFRARWDRGEETELVVVLRSGSGDLDSLPYDLLQAGRRMSFSLGEIFPHLSYPVLSALDRGDLDALFEAQARHVPGELGENATKEFVLRHVFEIAPELIRKPSDLLRVLLRRHYRGQRVPWLLDERLIQLLRQNGTFADWPLETIIPDREAFFAFLQERWPAFLDSTAAQEQGGTGEDERGYGFDVPGPVNLPFDHDDVRVYIDNLFLDGVLHPVAHEQAASLSKSWVRVGVSVDPQSDRLRRTEGLLEIVEAGIPGENARHADWLQFACRWAELSVLTLESNGTLPEQVLERIENLRFQVDSSIKAWALRRYAGLVNLPAVPPIMLHHVPRFLLRNGPESRQHKVALVVLDGLSLEQWIVLREELSRQRPGLRFREQAVFAWIPTITSVSRQATFAGKPPLYFPASIFTTEREPLLWSQFWADQGLTQNEVGYLKVSGDGSPSESGVEDLMPPRIRVIGLVIDKIDQIMHGMVLGSSGMLNQVRQWTKQGFLARLFDQLLANDFLVYLASDHGNIEASGCGRPAEGAVADLRGERTRVYADSLLRSQVRERFPESVEWPPVGLPEDFLPLLAPDRSAFVRETERIVCHGGLSVEELIVPFIQIERKET